MKSSINRSTDIRIEDPNRNQQVKPSHVKRIPKKPRRGATRERGDDLLDRRRPLSQMAAALERPTPLTGAAEQPGVGVTNPPLTNPRTDDQVESKRESQDLIPSLTATQITRLVIAIRIKKHDAPRQTKRRVRDQPEPAVKTETEEKKPPRPVTPESVIRSEEEHAFAPKEVVTPFEHNPVKQPEPAVPSLADVLALRATRQGLPIFCQYMVRRIQDYRVLLFQSPIILQPLSTYHLGRCK